jgi:hypothetical protein
MITSIFFAPFNSPRGKKAEMRTTFVVPGTEPPVGTAAAGQNGRLTPVLTVHSGAVGRPERNSMYTYFKIKKSFVKNN